MQHFASEVITPLVQTLETKAVEEGSKLILYGIITFFLLMAAFTLTMLLLRKKFIKTKDKHYLQLP